MNLLGAALYDPAAAVSKATSSLLAMTAFDTTNLRVTVTVPSHGRIRFRLVCTVTGATTVPTILLGVLNGATVVGRVAPVFEPATANAATQNFTCVADFTVTGLAAGSTSFDAAYAVQVVVASTNVKYGGPNNNSGANAWGAFTFEIWDPSPNPTNFGLTSIDANGRVDVIKVAGTTQTAKDIGGAVPSAAAGASGGLLISGSNSGTTTLGALTVTGVTTHTGNVVLSDGLTISAPSTTNRPGLDIAGNGTGAGIKSTGGATGIGFSVIGGATSGDGIKVTTTSGHGVNLAPVGTSMHGLLVTGGNGGTSDGIKAAAGTGGVDIRGNITGNITGTLATLTTYTGNTPQTGDAFARIGAAGAGLTALGDTRIANLDATVSSRMATYTQPTGFLAATFPAGTVANTTNITGGTITTVTNLTNAPTSGDLTATMKTSVTTAATAATPALSAAGVQAIWDALTSALTTVGSVGKLLADNINATIGSRLASASYTAPLDAAGTRTAIGLASANLDTQLTAIDDYIDTEVAAIKAKTDNLPAAPAAVGDIPTANANADALLDRADGVETGSTLRQAMRIMLAVLAGKASGLNTTTATFRDTNDSKNRITATVDANGNRSAVTLDAS